MVITRRTRLNAYTELIKEFKRLDELPEDEKKSILKVVSSLIRDFKARQTYLVL